MSENSLPKFFDSHLQEIAEQSASKISSFRANLDAVSSDIKNLERWLRESGVCLPFRVQLDQRYEFSEPDRHNIANDFYHGPARQITEQLAWDCHEPSGHWRIIYLREAAEAQILLDEGVVDQISVGKGEVEEFRPLIEMSGQIRLRAYKKLSNLLSAISEGIRLDQVRSEDIEFWRMMKGLKKPKREG